jgi:hypothetical protein
MSEVTNNGAGIVMYENVGYVYPRGEGPGGPVGGFGPVRSHRGAARGVQEADEGPDADSLGRQCRQVASSTSSLRLSRLFAEKINKYGGKAEVLLLPDAGLTGNTHIPFADMNNVAVADLLSTFLAQHGLGAR